MTSKDKAVVSLPVSPWDAILKAAKDQLPSLDSDSSLVSKKILTVQPGQGQLRALLSTDRTLVYGLCSHSSVSGITSGYPLPSGFSLGLPEHLSVDISALYLQGHSCCGPDPQLGSVPKSRVFPPCCSAALNSVGSGQSQLQPLRVIIMPEPHSMAQQGFCYLR